MNSTRQYHQDGSSPTGPEIFVFGSNEAGRHGAGAAKAAKIQFGAVYGVGRGPTGQSYAIPTKDKDLRTLSLEKIEKSVNDFLDYARLYPEKTFFVTRIGCDLAGYKNEDVAPMFKNAPANCSFAKEWRAYMHASPLLAEEDALAGPTPQNAP